MSEPKEQYGGKRPEKSEHLEEVWNQIHVYARGEYDPGWKKSDAAPFLKEMSEKGALGEVVVDVCAGRSQLARALADRHVVGTLDIVSANPANPEHFSVQTDVRHLDSLTRRTKTDLLKAADVLRAHGLPLQVNTFVFSDALNYLNYKKVFRELNIVLAPHGRVVIFNGPNFGPPEFMEPNETRLKTTGELITFLSSPPPEGMGYVIEKGNELSDEELRDPYPWQRHTVVARKPAD